MTVHSLPAPALFLSRLLRNQNYFRTASGEEKIQLAKKLFCIVDYTILIFEFEYEYE